MNDMNLIQLYKNDLLPEKEIEYLKDINEEITDTLNKRQIHRTETEMRVSVLQDGKHPTKASKYWQSVREQSVMVEGLIQLGFSYRKNDIQIRRKKADLETAEGFDKEEMEIELEELEMAKVNIRAMAFDRMREVRLWSKIKKELDDGSFNTHNVDEHQKESLMKTLENRAKTLTNNSSQAEIINVLGPLETIQKLNGINTLESREFAKLEN